MALIANPAQAQIAFDRPGSSVAGGIDIDGDGVFDDGTWSLANNGRGLNALNITPDGGIAARYNRGGNVAYTVDADFTATLTDPEVTFQLGVFGNEGLGQTYESKAVSYQVSWTGITGTADIIDPNPPTYVEDQIIDSSIVHTPSSVSIEQTFPTPGVVPNGCTWNAAGNWRNFCLEWGILAPNGATALNIVAAGGTAREGYRFAAISYADLIVNKSVSDATLAVGGTGFFTITLENNNISGNSVALNTKLTDILPAGLSYTGEVISSDGANTGGSYDSATGVWNIGRVSLGETVELQINFTVDSGTEGTILTNTIDPVTITSSQTDPTDNNGSLSAQLAIGTPEADLVTVKSLASSDSTPAVGDTVTFEIEVTNNGGSNATGVSLTDLIPTGLTATANNGGVTGTGGSSGGNYDDTSGLWTIGTLADGETATLTIEGTVNAGQANQTITNTLANPATGDQTDPTTIGDDLTEAVTVAASFNGGTGPALTCPISTLSTTDLLTDDDGSYDGTNLVSYADAASSGVGVTITKLSGSDSAGGNSAPFYAAAFADPVRGLWLGSDDEFMSKHVNEGLDSEAYRIDFDTAVDQATLDFTALNFNLDGDERIEITGINGAPVTAATNFQFTASGDIVFNTATGRIEGGPSYTAAGGNGGSLVIDNAAGITSISFSRVEIENLASSKVNPARHRTNGVVLGPVSFCAPITEADLVTVKTLSSNDATPAVGDTVTFEIEVTNNGGADATGVSLTDLIPSGLTATSNNGDVTGAGGSSGGSYNHTSGLWTIGSLANGETATLTIEGTVDVGQGGNTITNSLANPATGDQSDPTDDGNDLTDSIIVEEIVVQPAFPSGGGLSSSVCQAMPATNPYQDIGFRWEYNNNGGTSPNASIDQTSFIASATPGTFSGVSGQVNSFDLNLNANQIPNNYDSNTYIEYQFTTANFTNNAELTGFGATVFEATKASHIQDTGAYHIAIAIDDDASFGSPDILINDVAFDGVNTGTASASTGASDTGQYEQNFAHWDANGDVVSLAPNTTYKMRVYPYGVSRVGKDNGQPYSNVVMFDDFMPKLKSCAPPSADLVTQKTLTSLDATPAVGDTVTFGITVTNNGDAEATGVSLTDLIPAGLTATTNNGGVTGTGGSSGGSYNDTSGLWTIGTLADGETATLTIEGTVDTGQNNQNIENITTVASGDQTDPTTTGDDLSESVSVNASADLSITKTNTAGENGEVDQTDDTVAPGSNTTYTLVVTNNGPDSVTGAVVTDTPTSGLTCTSTNAVNITGDGIPAGNYTIADLVGTGITLETLEDGQAATLTFTCEVN